MRDAFSVTDMEAKYQRMEIKYQRVLASIAASGTPPQQGVQPWYGMGIPSIADDVAPELPRAGKPLSKYTAWLGSG